MATKKDRLISQCVWNTQAGFDSQLCAPGQMPASLRLCKSPIHIRMLLSHSCFPLSLFHLPGTMGSRPLDSLSLGPNAFPMLLALKEKVVKHRFFFLI